MFQNDIKMFVGVFDLSTYANDYIVDNKRDNGEVIMTQISTMGPLQKYVFQGATPDAVIK
jgi:hypothetical protein